MYNTDIPPREELPTIRQLNRSSAIAACIAAFLYVAAYLPAEYGVDYTGLGGLTGLAEMGEIKMQLLREAHPERHNTPAATPAADQRSQGPKTVFAGLFIGTANAHEQGHGHRAADAMPGKHQVGAAGRKDEMSLTLKPGQGAEIKLRMKKGAKANFSWAVAGGTANFDMHGDGPAGVSKSYKRGRSVGGDEGIIEAAFNGLHGWFWRNRTRKPVTVKLWVNGDYTEIKRMM